MTVLTVEHYCNVIERLLDDAFSVGEGASPPSSSAQAELQQHLDDLQNDLEAGHLKAAAEDRERLTAIVLRLSKLESQTHARLSWFADLEQNLRERDE
jgi:phosphosulfolactate synthase (CoM biosynthesis protein A)